MTNPVGVGACPYFSWIIKSNEKNVMQLAYRIVLSLGDEIVWDTDKVQGDQATFVPYSGNVLKSHCRYEWTVTVWDNKGNDCSASAWFETTILDNKEWVAKWAESTIPRESSTMGFGNQPPPVMFRKGFALEKPIKHARLYATCHGVYQLTINGKRPDDRVFAPEFTSYAKYLCFQTYNVTALLQQSENVLGMYVGDGWYLSPKLKPLMDDYRPYPAVLFQLEVEYDDGSSQTIISDNDVKVATGAVTSSDLFAGERFDANKLMNGWDMPGFDDSAWSAAAVVDYGYDNLIAQIDPPSRPIMTLPAVKAYTSSKGEQIVDFGQVLAGRVRMRIDVPKGTEIILDHFETPDKNGNYFNNILGSGNIGAGCDQRVVYVSDGTQREYEPLFTFHGFRYVKVAGLSEVRAEDFSAVVISSESESIGTFECSDSRLNRLYENTRWSQRSNMLSIPTDCPQREKAGWTGDMLIYAKTALLNAHLTPFFTRWLKNMACDQSEIGGVPIVVPLVEEYKHIMERSGKAFKCGSDFGVAGWGDAAVMVPWDMYAITGNEQILHECYDMMKKWCNYIIRTAKENRGKKSIPADVDQYLWNTGFHFGEWLIPSLAKNGFGIKTIMSMRTTMKYTAPIFGWNSVRHLSKIADLLGYEKDAAQYADIADKMKDAIQKGVIGKNGKMPANFMGAYVLPIYFELVPDGLQEKFAEKLITMIRKNGGCLDTGFLGTPFILDALCKIGRHDMAYELLYQTKCPSWLFAVEKDATTIWESWYGFKDDGTPVSMSMNHYSFGCVDDWIFRYISGVEAASPGFKHIHICPRPDDSLTYAKRTYQSVYGEIACYWEKKDSAFRLEVAIPCNATATVTLPNNMTHEIGSGHYEFTCESEG